MRTRLQWSLFPLLTLLAATLLFYFNDSSELPLNKCSLLPYKHYWLSSKRIVTPQGVISGAVEVKGGNVVSIVSEGNWRKKSKTGQVVDYGEAVIMPGLIDV